MFIYYCLLSEKFEALEEGIKLIKICYSKITFRNHIIAILLQYSYNNIAIILL